jgi:predicted transcriptional regulator
MIAMISGDSSTIHTGCRNRVMLILQEISSRRPEIDAAIAEGLADSRAGRVSPAFASSEEFHAWLETEEGRTFTDAK